MQFLDVKTDFAFKKVFGSEQSKELLIDFLNAIINFEQATILYSTQLANSRLLIPIKSLY